MNHYSNLLIQSATAILFGAYLYRVVRLHIKTQPALFVMTQAAGGIAALLIWLAATEGRWTAADVAGVVFSALYLWRSRQRMHEYIDGVVTSRDMESVPDTVIIKRTTTASHGAEDQRAA